MSAGAGPRSTVRPALLALSLGHGCADLSSAALWALLPFLVVERDYSYATVGLFALTASVAGAVLQPLLGAHGDRRAGFWLMPGGLALAGLGVGAVGFVHSFPMTLAAVVVSTAGVAAYHPEGARWARRVSGGRINADMGVFSLGGSVGYALGPLLVAAALAPLGLRGTLVIPAVPFIAAGVLLYALRRQRRSSPARAEARRLASARGAEWRPFARLLLFTCAAGGVTMGLLTYVPLFLVHERGTSPGASNVLTSVLLAAGAAGTLLGGLVAQRFGRRLALVAPQLALAPLIALLPALGYVPMLPIVALIGLAMNAYISITLVLAQEYLPAHMGLATGLTVGLSSGVGGLFVAALGVLGDRAGAAAVLYAVAALPLIVAALGASLPRPATAPPRPLPALEVETGS
jgi:FSR family fosmidomycin resistance protein-like MFS transporter